MVATVMPAGGGGWDTQPRKMGLAVPAVTLPAGTVAGVVRADIATAIQTMAPIIAA